MDKKYTLALVSHTHWDREWYLPFQQFRIKLVQLTDKLLDILDRDPEFKTFVFDGQTVVLEDYLEIRPKERERITRLVQAGRLKIGPWYILPDEYLVSGEATIRNLLLGHLVAEQFGSAMKSGYVPDPFGHISQLPQILKGFGLQDFYFTRGLGLEKEQMTCEFWWEAPDGSRVLAVNQSGTYCNACNLGYTRDPDGTIEVDYELAMEQIESQIEKLGPRCVSTILLLNNGCDHLEAQPEIPEIIRRANEKLQEATVVHVGYDDVGRMILAQKPMLPTYRGELRAGKYMHILPGVLSARMYIKQANERTQTLLEKWTEPFSALAYAFGGEYESELVWMAWKLCLQNHPHDSICGCSIDQVHREMMPRFEQSQQIGETLAAEGLAHLARQINTAFDIPENAKPVVIFNALNWETSEPVTVRMSGMLESDKAPACFVVRDSGGNVVPSQVSNPKRTELQKHRLLWESDLTFLPGKVSSLGFKTFSVERAEFHQVGGKSVLAEQLVAGENVIENEFVRVVAYGNGTFDLTDKQTGNTFSGCNLLEDTEDIGDEYDYSPARAGATITSSGSSGVVSIADSGDVFATLRIDTELRLPVAMSADRDTRSRETVACPVSVNITVRRGSPRVDIVTEFVNNAKDHRLRAWFPVGCAAATHQAESQFHIIERPNEMPDGEGWWQKPQPEQPMQSFVNVQADGRGLAVIGQGLPEYEVMRPKDTIIALTLLRCCGWLSTANLLTRDSTAGPEIQTPEAQCLGKQVFHYAVFAHGGDWTKANVWRQAHQHNVPLRGVFTGIHGGRLPVEHSFLTIEPANIVVSALKKSDRSDGMILRIYNTTDKQVTATIRPGFAVSSVIPTNMNEEPAGEPLLAAGDGSFSLEAPGHRVQTLCIEL